MKGRYEKTTLNLTDRFFDKCDRLRDMELARDRLHPDLRLLLECVPMRGTELWERREELRARMGCKCLSWGEIGSKWRLI